MQTATTPAPPPKLMNRGQQARAMEGIKAFEAADARKAGMDFKYSKQDTDNTLKTLKLIMQSKQGDEKFDKEIEEMRLATKGQSLGMQKYIIDKQLALWMNEADNAAGITRSRISASRPRSGGSGFKMPPELNVIHKAYNEARSKIQSEKSLAAQMGRQVDPAKIKKFKNEEKYWKDQWDEKRKPYPQMPDMPSDYVEAPTEEDE
jgi:hypothetical protein